MMNKNKVNNKLDQSMPSPDGHGEIYQIHVKGQLDESWSDWLEGLDVKLVENGEMILCGRIGDQASLMGVLNKLYGLNLTLLSVSKMPRFGQDSKGEASQKK